MREAAAPAERLRFSQLDVRLRGERVHASRLQEQKKKQGPCYVFAGLGTLATRSKQPATSLPREPAGVGGV